MNFKWSRDLEVGHTEIDKQHRELIRVYNNLNDICNSKTSEKEKNEKVSEALNFLCLYTVQHFTDEEAIQNESGFPGFEKHKEHHEYFKNMAFFLSKKFAEVGFSEKFMDILDNQIGAWLVSHIQKEDIQIADYIKNK